MSRPPRLPRPGPDGFVNLPAEWAGRTGQYFEDLAYLIPNGFILQMIRSPRAHRSRDLDRYVARRFARLLVQMGVPVIRQARLPWRGERGQPVYGEPRYFVQQDDVARTTAEIGRIISIGLGQTEAMWQARDRAGRP